jgi:alpha-glucosidase
VNNRGAHLPFNFQLLMVPWKANQLAAVITEYEGAIPANGWPNWVLGNHDQPRIASRIGNDQARVAAILLLTLRGTPTIYYGEEIGMRDVPIPFNRIHDPQGINMPGKNLSRDPARTPMQWDNTQHGGFSDTDPWLPCGNFRNINAATQKHDLRSMLALYHKLIRLRKTEPVLQHGNYKLVYSDQNGLAYLRSREGNSSLLIVLNLSHRIFYFTPKDPFEGIVILSASGEWDALPVKDSIILGGDEGLIIRLNTDAHETGL